MKRINKELLEELNMKQRTTITEPLLPPESPKTAEKPNQQSEATNQQLIEDSILDGITQKSKAEDGMKSTRRNQVNTAKASFRHKSV